MQLPFWSCIYRIESSLSIPIDLLILAMIVDATSSPNPGQSTIGGGVPAGFPPFSSSPGIVKPAVPLLEAVFPDPDDP